MKDMGKRTGKITGAGRLVSFFLMLVMLLTVLLGAGVTAGVDLASAAGGQSSELWLLCDYSYSLVRGTRQANSDKAIDAAPYSYMGDSLTFYTPLSPLCAYTGASWSIAADGKTVTVTHSAKNQDVLTIGETAWQDNGTSGTLLLPPLLKDGEVYVSAMSARSIFSLKSFFNSEIGLIVFSSASLSYSTSYSSTQSQVNALRYLLFQTPTSGVYSDLVSNLGADDVHPRLLVTQDRFDYLREIYERGQAALAQPNGLLDDVLNEEEIRLYTQIRANVVSGMRYFEEYFAETNGVVDWRDADALVAMQQPFYLYDENGDPLPGETSYTFTDPETGEPVTVDMDNGQDYYGWYSAPSGYGDGYDEGGRSGLSRWTKKLKIMAFTWLMTGESRYVEGFYLFARQLGEWVHWGEGHFLDCADGAVEYALGLDWIYHGFDQDADGGVARRAELAKILYDKAITVAYYGITDTSNTQGYLHRSGIMGGNWNLVSYTNNWMTVCASGIITSALTVLEYEEYRDRADWLIGTLMDSIYKCLMQYVPDGAYIESPGYWAYGTNTYMRLLGVLVSATGTDYGFLDTIGLQQSYYYIYNVCDSAFRIWNYHDGGRTTVDGSYFYLASLLYDDPTIALQRDTMLTSEDYNGSTTDIMDLLFYSASLSEGGEQPALDYEMRGIDSVTMRSSWEEGRYATFAGLHAGANNVSHGDIDSGNFYLEMGGVLWFGDPGAEDYNIGGYWTTSTRYKFYRKTLESHNSIMILNDSSLPHGQVFNSTSQTHATITRFESNEYGSIAVANMQPQYGSNCSSAVRALMLTNDRRTVVLQDEISFSQAADVLWIATPQNLQSISEDGKTVVLCTYANNSSGTRLRISLVSDDPTLKFTRRTPTDGTVLSTTVAKGSAANTTSSGEVKYERASAMSDRLCIEASGVTDLKLAVVFELFEDEWEMENYAVGYQLTDVSSWQTDDGSWLDDLNAGLERPHVYAYKLSDIVGANNKIAYAQKNGDTQKAQQLILETIRILTDIDKSNASVRKAIDTYLTTYLLPYADALLPALEAGTAPLSVLVENRALIFTNTGESTVLQRQWRLRSVCQTYNNKIAAANGSFSQILGQTVGYVPTGRE